MNKIKARTQDGKTILLHVQQNPSPVQFSQRQPWPSAARVKAKAMRMGLVLAGKRQP